MDRKILINKNLICLAWLFPQEYVGIHTQSVTLNFISNVDPIEVII